MIKSFYIRKNQLIKDIGLAYLVFFISVVIRNSLPEQFVLIYFLSLLVIFFKSDKYYFWLAVLFVFIDSPAGFFPTNNEYYSLPLVPFPGMPRNINFSEIFIIVAALKTVNMKVRNKFFLKNSLSLLGIYFIFLILISNFYEISLLKMLNTARHVIPYLFFFIIPRLLKDEEDFQKFLNIIFAFIFLLFVSQMYELVSGAKFTSLFGQTKLSLLGKSSGVIDPAEETARVIYSVHIILLSFVFSLFFFFLFFFFCIFFFFFFQAEDGIRDISV